MRRVAKIAAALIVVLLALVPAAAAAPPANDDFADRQPLAGALPITATGTNLEATKEAEEPPFGSLGLFASGHTIWYEWEATSSGFVTVNTCDSSMRAVLAVFTGTALNALTEVAGDFATQGPDCPDFYGEAVTFRAVSGTTYAIGIDGSSPFPEEEHPGQGAVDLEILETPPPANDDFADARVLSGEMLGVIYAAGAEGHSWNATKEPGEPAHSGDPGGASVWYSWTAPETGRYLFSCGRATGAVFAFYTGSAVDTLAPVGFSGECSLRLFDAVQETTYRIAIDGKFNSSIGAAEAGVVSLNISREPPAPPSTWKEPPWLEGRRVNTLLQKRVVRPKQRRATFVFGATEPGARFICKLDKRPEGFCTSPKTYRRLKPGKHVFKVAAIGDTTSAVARFQIPKPKPRPKK